MAKRVLKKKTTSIAAHTTASRTHRKKPSAFMRAWKGVADFLETNHSILFQAFILFVVIMMGIQYDIEQVEWQMIIMASGLLLAAELFSGAIQKDLHYASPHHYKGAEAAQNMASGAVLICALTASIIFVTIFGPRVLEFLITFYPL